MNDFYVYIFFRPDGRPLYVGKGRKNRWLYFFGRSQYVQRIIVKAGGSIPSVKLHEGLSEEQAFLYEKLLIAAIGRMKNGGPLANFTDGGEGVSGLTVVRSVETCENIRRSKLGHAVSDATRQKIRETLTGRVIPEPVRAKLRESCKNSPVLQAHLLALNEKQKGRSIPEEQRRKISATLMGRKFTDERRANCARAQQKRYAANDK